MELAWKFEFAQSHARRYPLRISAGEGARIERKQSSTVPDKMRSGDDHNRCFRLVRKLPGVDAAKCRSTIEKVGEVLVEDFAVLWNKDAIGDYRPESIGVGGMEPRQAPWNRRNRLEPAPKPRVASNASVCHAPCPVGLVPVRMLATKSRR